MSSCHKRAELTFSEQFDAFAMAYGNCVIGDKPAGTDCSEFDQNNGPMETALVRGIKRVPANRNTLVDALAQDAQPTRQQAAFWILEQTQSRKEMLPICQKLAQNPDSKMIVTVLDYLLEIGTNKAQLNLDPDSYRMAHEIARDTISKTESSQNVTVIANMVNDFGVTEKSDLALQFLLAFSRHIKEKSPSVKLVRNIVRQSYYYGFIDEKRFPEMRKQVEAKWDPNVADEMFKFTGQYGSQRKKAN